MSVTTEPSESMLDRAARLRDHVDELRAHGSVEEAETALTRLTELMLKHSIDMTSLDGRDGSFASPIVAVELPFTGIYRIVLAPYLGWLAATYRVTGTAFIQRSGNVTVLTLVGLRADVEQLRDQLTWVADSARRGMNQWWADLRPDQRSDGMAGYKARRQFIISFIKGIGSGVAERRDAAIEQRADQLVVRSQQRRIDEFVAENYRLRSGARSRVKPGSAASARAGYAAGQRAGDESTGSTALPRQLRP